MAARRHEKGDWPLARTARWGSRNLAGLAGAPTFVRWARLVVAVAVCLAGLAGLASAAPQARASAARPGVAASRAAALAARRALVRRELSPAGEQAAARAAEARLSARERKPHLAWLRSIAGQERRAVESHGPSARGMPRPVPSGVTGAATAPAASGGAGFPGGYVVTGPGGSILDYCDNFPTTCDPAVAPDGLPDSMVAPGEPVTVSVQMWNDSNPPVSEQVQAVIQESCLNSSNGAITETVLDTTVTAPSIYGTAPSGTPVSATFNVFSAACANSPGIYPPQHYALYISGTVVGQGGACPSECNTESTFFFYGSVPFSQLQGCVCSPDSSGGTAAQQFRGDAVGTGTGEYADSFTDAAASSPGVPLSVTRDYSSGVSAAGPLGRGWTMPWFASLAADAAAGTVTFDSENGSQYVYVSNGDGTFTAPLGALSVLTAVTDSLGNVTGYKLVTPQQDVLSFTASGRLTSDLDPTGRGLTFAYSSGQLSSVTDAAGQQATLTWSGGRLTGIGLPDGTSVSYGYSGGLLTSVVTPGGTSGATTSYTYNPAGLLATIVGPDGGTVLQNSYNSAGQVTSSTDGIGAVTTFSYATVNGLGETDTTAPDGGVWTDVYGGGMLLQTIDPLNAATEYVPGDTLLPVQVTGPLGGVTTLSYDGSGNLLSVTDPLSRQRSWTYDSRDNLLSYTDGRGHATTFTYNAMDEVTSVTGAAGGKATFTYDAAGNLASRVDPRGNVTGATASDFTTTYAYDPGGLLASVTSPGGGTESFGYDAMGFPVTVTDPAGLVTRYAYNGQQQVTSVTAPDGGVTRYGYDAAGYLTSRTDPDGHAWTYGHDGDGRVVKVTDPLGKPVTYGYDGDGNQVKFTDARGLVTAAGYDADGRPVTITHSDSTPTVTYGYDAAGRVTSVSDGTGSRALRYDADGELTSAGGFSYAYDADGNVTSRTYPDKTVVAYTYTPGEQIASVSQGSSKTSYAYDAAGNLATAVQPAGVTQAFTYDGAGRLVKISDTVGAAVLDSWALTLNADGEPTTVAATLAGKAQPTTSYGYDAAGRLAKAGGTGYGYDPAGNLTTQTTGATPTTYSYNADEELTKAITGSTTTSYGYDADGDQTTAGGKTYTYNAEGEMTSATTTTGRATYSYDASGDVVLAGISGQTQSIAWDINNPLPAAAETLNDSGFTATASGAPRVAAVPAATAVTVTTDYAYGADGLLASESTNLPTAPGTFSPVTDWLGSVTGLVSSAGTQQTKTTYGPYGTATTTSLVTGAPASAIGYAGSYTLPASGGLDDMRARDYNPATGSFLTLDPMLAVTGLPYAYASDVPDYYTDPSGRIFGIDNLIAGGIGAIVGAGGVLFNELLFGKKVKWSSIAIAAASGFAFGALADECGPICAGAAAGFVTDGLTQIVNHHGFSGFNLSELARETAQGAATGTIDEFLGNGGGKHAAEDTAALVSKYAIPDFYVGATDPAAISANPLGALCALMDNPGDSGI